MPGGETRYDPIPRVLNPTKKRFLNRDEFIRQLISILAARCIEAGMKLKRIIIDAVERRFFHGARDPGDIAETLVAELSRGSLQGRALGGAATCLTYGPGELTEP